MLFRSVVSGANDRAVRAIGYAFECRWLGRGVPGGAGQVHVVDGERREQSALARSARRARVGLTDEHIEVDVVEPGVPCAPCEILLRARRGRELELLDAELLVRPGARANRKLLEGSRIGERCCTSRRTRNRHDQSRRKKGGDSPQEPLHSPKLAVGVHPDGRLPDGRAHV